MEIKVDTRFKKEGTASLYIVGPMLLPGAGIYMVRGGGSCGGKHRVVTRVRH